MSLLFSLRTLRTLSETFKEASENLLELMFFLKQGRSVEATPKHLIIVDGAILQPIPEHPKRDFIFCLSTAFGDAYLFQAPCQVELDNWVNSIHSACAAAFARHRGKTGTLHLLQVEMMRYETGLGDNKKIVRNVGSPLSDWSSCYQAESRDDLVLMGHFVLQLTPL